MGRQPAVLLSCCASSAHRTCCQARLPLPHAASSRPLVQGDPGDLFYIIKEGEAVVFQDSGGTRKRVNQLFKADFFGEGALLSDEPRRAGSASF